MPTLVAWIAVVFIKGRLNKRTYQRPVNNKTYRRKENMRGEQRQKRGGYDQNVSQIRETSQLADRMFLQI